MHKQKTKDTSGFTLAELLIVVAIIGVLVSISIPIFTSSKKKSTAAVNAANIRSAMGACVAILMEEKNCEYLADGSTREASNTSINTAPETITDDAVYSGSVFVWLDNEGNIKSRPSIQSEGGNQNTAKEPNTFITPSGETIILTSKEATLVNKKGRNAVYRANRGDYAMKNGVKYIFIGRGDTESKIGGSDWVPVK